MCLPGWGGKHTPVNGRMDRFHFQDQLQRTGSGSPDSHPKKYPVPFSGPQEGNPNGPVSPARSTTGWPGPLLGQGTAVGGWSWGTWQGREGCPEMSHPGAKGLRVRGGAGGELLFPGCRVSFAEEEKSSGDG